jgi:hypothetical protein
MSNKSNKFIGRVSNPGKVRYHVQEILLGLVQLLQLVFEGQALVFRVGDLKSKVEDKDPFSFPEKELSLNILEEEKLKMKN